MFAFAVWDEQDKTLFLARDPMGQKPLYLMRGPCADRPVTIAFASELPALRPLAWFDPVTSDAALVEYLRWGYVATDDQDTIFESVGKVAPGMWLRVDAYGREVSQYYFSPNRADPADELRTAAGTRCRVVTAVSRQLVADVPLGCLLSGGMDSSVVAAAMRATIAPDQPLLTFSIGFDDPRYDETGPAAAVAAHVGATHHRFVVRPDAVADLPRLAGVFGEPFGDSSALPTHYLSREARRHVKVVLGGDGGDELFGGYDRYRAIGLERHLSRVPPTVRSALAAAGRAVPASRPKSRLHRAGRLLRSVAQPVAERYAGYLRLFTDAVLGQLLAPPVTIDLDFVAVSFDAMRPARDPMQAALAVDRFIYLPEDLLTKVDRASMLCNLEVRSPFMDPDVVTFAAGLTTDQLLKGGPKRMLREAFADDLPAWVFKRKKMGFAVPVGDWFRGPLRAMLRDTLFSAHAFGRSHFDMAVVQRLVDEHESRRVDHGQRLYALLMLELWWDTVRAPA